MRGIVGKLFVAALLALCASVYLLEMSGRWDRSIQDANDEAAIVAVVFCVGVALSAAGSLIKFIRASRAGSRGVFNPLTAPRHRDELRLALPACIHSPPAGLRI